MLAAQTRERRRCGAEDATGVSVVCLHQSVSQFVRDGVRSRLVFVPNQHQRQRDKRRISVIAPVANLFVKEPSIVLRTRMAQRVMVGMISLDQNASGKIAATGATRDLGNQRKGALGGAKVRQSQSGINRHDADQRDVGKVVSLRQHLRPHQQIDLAFSEIEQRRFEFMTALFGVAIDAADAQLRKALAQEFFDLFGAFTYVIDELAGANGALRRRALVMIAIVADQRAIALVISEGHVAVGTTDRLAAGAAQNEARVAAAVEHDDPLLFARARLLY